MTIVDTVAAHTLEKPDQITFMDRGYQEIMTVVSVIDSGDSIMVKGDSWVSGDSVTYIFHPDKEVDLWRV
jgi:hypothetical protein